MLQRIIMKLKEIDLAHSPFPVTLISRQSVSPKHPIFEGHHISKVLFFLATSNLIYKSLTLNVIVRQHFLSLARNCPLNTAKRNKHHDFTTGDDSYVLCNLSNLNIYLEFCWHVFTCIRVLSSYI